MQAFNPGCCCEEAPPTCDLLIDDFNRADDTDLGSDWNEVAPGIEIVSNKAKYTATTDPYVLCTTPHSSPDVSIQATVRRSTEGASGPGVRLIFDWVDANNFCYAQLLQPSLSIHSVVGGVDTELTSQSQGFLQNTDHVLHACLKGSFLVTWRDSGSRLGYNVPTPTSGYFGFGFTGSLSGTTTVDDFSAQKVEDGCAECVSDGEPCDSCTEGTTPKYVLLTIDGSSIVDGDCADCEVAELAVEDDFLLGPLSSSFPCNKLRLFGEPNDMCSTGFITSPQMAFEFASDGLRAQLVQSNTLGNVILFEWFLPLTAPYNCRDIDDVELPLVFASDECGGSPTCKVTSL